MAATAAKRSALFMRASKEIYMAAKSGVPDPEMNLALRSAIEKWRGQNVTKDVIERAIQKAKGGEASWTLSVTALSAAESDLSTATTVVRTLTPAQRFSTSPRHPLAWLFALLAILFFIL